MNSVELEQGIAVSPGIAIGNALLLEAEDLEIAPRPISARAVDDEIARFEEAVEAAVEELADLRRAKGLTEELAQLFEAHIVMLRDRKLKEQVATAIREGRLGAEYCVQEVFEEHARRFSGIEDEYLAERANDVRDLEHRLLRRLSGGRQENLGSLADPVILVARDLSPSQTATLDRKMILGIAIDIGGRTSHTAIVARSLGIPAVVGLKDLSSKLKSGAELVLDGNRGRVVVDPDPHTLSAFERLRREYQAYRESLESSRHLIAETLDGYRIELFGNIERPADASAVLAHGGDGVGLFRTEFLFEDPFHLPSEDEQYQAYLDTVERLEGKPLVVRTLDFGGDKLVVDPRLAREPNPFLGLRSLRYCLKHPEMFLPQLKAILRASAHGDVRIMFPMVATVDEVRLARGLLDDARDALRAERRKFRDDLPIGIMVETPSAALTADSLAREVSFFSVGTNDLIQYALAVDRGNEKVASLYQPGHPAILRLLERVIRAGVERGVSVSVCGEICSEPTFTMLLLGMGLRELSLAPASIPEIKKVIRSVSMERAREVASTALSMSDAAQTERFLHASLRQILPMIF